MAEEALKQTMARLRVEENDVRELAKAPWDSPRLSVFEIGAAKGRPKIIVIDEEGEVTA